MKFTAIIRCIHPENSSDRNRHPLLQRRRMFALVIVLLSIACIAPGVATATKDDQRLGTSKHLKRTDHGTLGALETGVANDCAPTNGTKTGNCTATKTSTSSDCYSGANRTTAAQPTDHSTDSESTVTSSSNTDTTVAEPNTKASQKADRANAHGFGLLPDINSPTIAIIGILCVIGGLIALAR